MPPSFPALAQRLQRREELPEDARAGLGRRPVDAAAVVDRQPFAQVGRHLLELHRVARHQPERLHVHDEAGRRAVGPALHHRLGRDAVVGRIDLDRREALGVVGQPLARGRARRVPVLHEGVVGPRAGADANGGGHGDAIHYGCVRRPPDRRFRLRRRRVDRPPRVPGDDAERGLRLPRRPCAPALRPAAAGRDSPVRARDRPLPRGGGREDDRRRVQRRDLGRACPISSRCCRCPCSA